MVEITELTHHLFPVCNLARGTFAWRESGKGERRLTTNHFWPKCQLELKGVFVRTQHKPRRMVQQLHSADTDWVPVLC